MRRRSRPTAGAGGRAPLTVRAAAAAGVLAAVLLGAASPAVAAPLGGLAVAPAASIDTASIVVHTSAGCPAQADNYYAIARGHGFPPAGQIVTAPTAAGLSHHGGFDVYFAQTMKDFATDNHSTLTGRYDVTVLCIDSFTRTSFGEFTGSLTFRTPTRYVSASDGVAARPPAAPRPAASQPATPLPATPRPATTTTVATVRGDRAAPRPAPGGTPLIWVVVSVAVAALIAFEAGRRLGRAQRS